MLAIPFILLGTGLYRAWIEILFISPHFDFATSAVEGFNVHDISMALTLLICAALAKMFSPLFKKKYAYILCTLCALISSILKLSILFIDYSSSQLVIVDVLSNIGGGFSTALLLLLWAELFSTLPPLKVAIAYTLSFLLGYALVHGLILLSFLGQVIFTILLPLVSLTMVYKSFTNIASDDLPPERYESFPFPWKPVLMMMLFAFAYSLREQAMYQNIGPMSSLGLLLICSFVILMLVILPDTHASLKFLRYVLPGIAVIAIVGSFFSSDFYFSNIFLNISFNAFNIFIMLIFANIAYRYGVSALWLFGIERGIRALTMVGSRYFSELVLTNSTINQTFQTINPIIVTILLIAFSYLVINQQAKKDDWGLISSKKVITDPHMLERARIAALVDDASETYQLTPRQTEVFELLIKGKSINEIQTILVIAKGTAKAHLSNIYQKVGVSSKEELLAKFKPNTIGR